MSIVLRLLLFGALPFLAACASNENKSATPSPLLEVITAEEELLASVAAHPTSFTIPFEQDPQSWMRATTFFKFYLKESVPKGAVNKLTNWNNTQAPYRYSITKNPTSGGYSYHIACTANPTQGGRPEAQQRNAQNVARFIREGVLELSILAQ